MDIVTFYRFVDLDDLSGWQARLLAFCNDRDLVGTILLADEGINGTVAGLAPAIDALSEHLTAASEFADMPFKRSRVDSDNPVFLRMKVRIKREIVSLGQGPVAVAQRTGTHVDADAWNRLLDDPDVAVIDTRNRYEVEVGSFDGAHDPDTRSFREFPAYIEERFGDRRDQPVAMFCTGGIRCEKASSWLLEQGFEKVYQLDGGILRYLETVPDSANRWRGECFVFDQRVAVDSQLAEGGYVQCHACRRPLSEADQRSEHTVVGVSCPHCIDEKSDEERASYAERQRQMELAQARGEQHIGPKAGQPEPR